MLLRSLGVQHLIVAVNKMDMCGWAEARFTEIHSKISTFLKKTGFRDSNVRYVPVSGFTGENLVEGISSANCSWFKGPTLLNQIGESNPAPPLFLVHTHTHTRARARARMHANTRMHTRHMHTRTRTRWFCFYVSWGWSVGLCGGSVLAYF